MRRVVYRCFTFVQDLYGQVMLALRRWSRRHMVRAAWLCLVLLSCALVLAAGLWLNTNYLGFLQGPQRAYHVAYPHPYNFTLDEQCQGDRAPFLVLMVPVAPGDPASRRAIRETWGKEGVVLGRAVRLFFLLGMPSGAGAGRQQEEVMLESLEHHDLLQSDFLDSYFNLTIKTMMMLEWLSSHCPQASFAMKVDSDMFLNVHNLVSMLADPNVPRKGYITGQVNRFGLVLRDPASKWYLPVEVYPFFRYPTYVLGYCYVLSLDLPGQIVEASRHVRTVHIEDVYVGMCLAQIGVLPSDPPRDQLFSINVKHYSHCSYDGLIATMTNGAEHLMEIWEEFQKPGPSCTGSWFSLLLRNISMDW